MRIFRPLLLLCLPCALLMSTTVSAQEKYRPFDFGADIRTTHLWRGLEVSGSAFVATDVTLTNKSKTLTAGLWGGAAFDGTFKEFDYFVSFTKSGFTVALWDIFNFSPSPNPHDNIWGYDRKSSWHFIDLTVGYQLQGSLPLSLSWSTIIYGRDLYPETFDSRYSTYVALGCPAIRGGEVDVDLGVGGAFTLRQEDGDTRNFYAERAGIVNVNITFSKTLSLGTYNVPVAAMAMWNPVSGYANLQLKVKLF